MMSRLLTVINYLLVLLLVFVSLGYTVCSIYALWMHGINFNSFSFFSLGVSTITFASLAARGTMPRKE